MLNKDINNRELIMDYYTISNKIQYQNIRNYNDEAFRYAAEIGYLKAVKHLHRNGANIQACNYQAFRFASNNGHLDIVEYLYIYGTDMDVDIYYESLDRAFINRHTVVVEYRKKYIK